jgi:SAM-dependent methyltransferase
VLDVACGTGAVSRAAARGAGASGSVTGVDVGEPTLAIARSRPAEQGAAPIAYRQSEAGSLPLADDAFDVALCQQGLQFFPDRLKALAEMRRHRTRSSLDGRSPRARSRPSSTARPRKRNALSSTRSQSCWRLTPPPTAACGCR